ncbi:MAG: Ig-like domain-containing protein [Thermoanaerobaculaceae bacterium]
MHTTAASRRITLVAVALLALAVSAGPALAVSYVLRAEQFNKTYPTGAATSETVPMWGFALEASFGDTLGQLSVPGPRLVVPVGDTTLQITLDNNLAVPISLVIPGLTQTGMVPVRFPASDPDYPDRIRSLTYETPAGNATPVTYTWTGVTPGSYMYHSGTQQQVQVQMGLYGAVTKEEAAGQAYPSLSTVFDKEVMLFFSEVDVEIHGAVAAGDYGPGKTVTSTIDYHPEFFLINGEPYPIAQPVASGILTGTDRVLLRIFNGGLETHVPVLLGLYMDRIAEDGRPYPYAERRYSTTLAALTTQDAILRPPTAAGTYPVFDRRLQTYNRLQSPGGMIAMLTFTGGVVTTPPVAVNDIATVAEDSNVVISVLANDYDTPQPPPNEGLDPASLAIVVPPLHGAAVPAPAGTVTYTPAANYFGSDTFSYIVRDAAGAASNPGVVTVTVTGVADPPVAVADAYLVSGALLSVPPLGVLANDSDPDGDTLTANLVTGPAKGTLSLFANGSFTYAPSVGATGTDTFTYRASDGALFSGNATVTLTLNSAPVAVNDQTSILWPQVATINVLANDSDPDGTLDPTSVTLVPGFGPTWGAVVINPTTGVVTYTPGATAFLLDSFRYTVRDNLGAVSNQATVTIQVLPSDILRITKAVYKPGDRRWEFSGRSSVPGPNNSVRVVLGSTMAGQLIGTATVGTTGRWTLSVRTPPGPVPVLSPPPLVSAASTAGGVVLGYQASIEY